MGVRGTRHASAHTPRCRASRHTNSFPTVLALARRFVLPIGRAELGEYFFPLAALFALHALPVRGSIPYQIVQKHPLNLLYIAAILCGAGLGLSALRVRDDDGVVRAFYICSLSVLCGPLIDLLMTAKAVAVFATTGVWPPPPAVPTPVNASVEKRGDQFRVFLNAETDPLMFKTDAGDDQGD